MMSRGADDKADQILYGSLPRVKIDPIVALDPADLLIKINYFEDYKLWSGTSGWAIRSTTLPRAWTEQSPVSAYKLLPGQMTTERITAIDEGNYDRDHTLSCQLQSSDHPDLLIATGFDQRELGSVDQLLPGIPRHLPLVFKDAVEALVPEKGEWRYQPFAPALAYTVGNYCNGVVWCVSSHQ